MEIAAEHAVGWFPSRLTRKGEGNGWMTAVLADRDGSSDAPRVQQLEVKL